MLKFKNSFSVRVKKFIVILLFFCTAFGNYGISLNNGFLIDDNHLVVKNKDISKITNPAVFFTQPMLRSYYRPITGIYFALDYSIWKLNPFGYHLTNILLHTCNAVLFFLLFLVLFKKIQLFLSAFIFLIHPLNSVSVN